jgi:putative cell wall-binding protein/subtilisin family serine protease/plastocyanin
MRGHPLRRSGLTLLVAFASLVSILAMAQSPPASAKEPAVASGVLVRLPATTLKSMGPEAGATLAAVENAIEDLGFGWILVEGDPDDPAVQAQVAELGGVAAPNTIYELLGDPLFPEQWGLENTGQAGGTPDADIDAPEAWTVTQGEPGQIVAVIDTGMDLDHPDLIDRLWTNTGEIPGNGIDDDSNGFIDDVNGWDFYGDGPTADSVPEDVTWHGTAVASAVAATRNDVGIAGVAPATTIMPIRVCRFSCPLSKIVAGVNYAIANGAGIINLSLGTPTLDQPLADAVTAANVAGVVVVTAAGNSSTDNDVTPMYPANFETPNVIAVAATDRSDVLWSSSNFGATSVDLAAPGKDLKLATLNGGWTIGSGTSLASPMVAGAAALVRAVLPSASPATVKQIVLDNVDAVPSLACKMVTGGRLNAANAATAATTGNVTPMADTSATTSVSGTPPLTVTLDGSASSDSDGVIDSYSWSDCAQTASGGTATMTFSLSGTYVVILTVTDDDGAIDRDTITIEVNEPPVADASATTPLSGTIPLTVDLNGSASADDDGSIVTWDWTDGTQTTSGKTAAMTFTTTGTHTVTLTVTDDDGATDTNTIEITANEPPNVAPTAVASGTPTTAKVPFTVDLDGTGSQDLDGTIMSWEWSDGPEPASGELTTMDFTTAGDYTITLTVTDDDGATATDTIDINALSANIPPTANTSATPTDGTAPLKVTFDGSGSSDSDGTIESYSWTDGTLTATGETAIMTFTNPGLYTVTLTVTDDDGATNTGTIDIEVGAAPVVVGRVAGADRYVTSALLSADTTDPGVPVVYVAAGTDFPDGLVAAAAAAQAGGAMLLVKPDAIPSAVANELDRLDPQSIVIAGGLAAISQDVEDILAGFTPTVSRLGGANRYETAALVSQGAFPTGTSIVYVTTGETFPDTMASVPAAAITNGPVLLVRSDSIPSATSREIKRLKPTQIIVVGGPVPISAALDEQLASLTGATVQRRFGPDRYATAAAISTATFFPGVPVVYIATGANHPDGLSGAAVGAIEGGPLLLTRRDSLPSSVAAELERLKPRRVFIVGGTNAVSNTVETKINTIVTTP